MNPLMRSKLEYANDNGSGNIIFIHPGEYADVNT